MKRTNPLTKKAIENWRDELNKPSEEEEALIEWKRQIRLSEVKDKAARVKQLISELNPTKRQLEIFYTYIDIGNAREVGRRLKVTEGRVREVVKRIKDYVLTHFNTYAVLV